MTADRDAGKWSFEGGESFFVFCDYFDSSRAYAIANLNSEQANNVVMVGTKTNLPIIVARSFTDFCLLYIRDDARIYPSETK